VKKTLKKYLKKSRVFAILLLGISMMLLISSVKATTAVISVIDAVNGSNSIMLPANTPAGTKFLVNVTITNVQNLAGWQINITFDPRLLNITATADMILPANHIFNGLDPQGPAPTIGDGYVMWARAVGPSAPADHFNGSGIICQIRFTTMKNGTGDPVQCDLVPDKVGTFPTSIIDPDANDIAFTVNKGTFTIPEFPVTTLLLAFLIITSIAIVLAKKTSMKHRKFSVAS
jgi:hypothetical protein